MNLSVPSANLLLLLTTTALASLALGMLIAKLEFQLSAFWSSLNPASTAAIAIGVVFYIAWVVKTVKQTNQLAQSTARSL